MISYPELRSRRVIVTGAAAPGSIGHATSIAFGQQGARVVCADIDAAGAEAVAAAVRDAGGEAIASRCDVTSEASVDAMVRATIGAFGGVDVLVNSAGGWTEQETIEQITGQRWDAMLALNLKSVFLCSRAVMAHMPGPYGRIINVASVSGRAPTPATPAYYSAAKAAVLALTKSLAHELAPRGVTVNAVAPGATASERFLRIRGDEGVEAMRRRIPLRRISTAEEQAAVVLFLASDGAAYVTGATLDVNGGSVMV